MCPSVGPSVCNASAVMLSLFGLSGKTYGRVSGLVSKRDARTDLKQVRMNDTNAPRMPKDQEKKYVNINIRRISTVALDAVSLQMGPVLSQPFRLII